MGTLISCLLSTVAWCIRQPRVISQLPVFLAVGLLVWFFILIFVIVPARRWRGDRKEKTELEQRLARKLGIVSGKGGPFVHRYPCPGLVEPKSMCITFRILVKNLSEARTVRNVNVRLSDTDPPLEFVPIHLHLMHDNIPPAKTSFDLHTGQEQYVDVFACREDPKSTMIFFQVAANGIRNAVPKRRYKLTIQATGEDVPDCMKSFVIDVDAEGKVSFRPGRRK